MDKPMENAASSGPKLYELKEQLLLLTTLVATVTYISGLNLPGGAWEAQDHDGHLAGDPILPDTHYHRYVAFYYCNATTLASSLVVCLILVMLSKKSTAWTTVLRAAMVLDLLGLVGSYAAGSFRDAFTTICALVLACPILAYVTYAFFCYLCMERRHRANANKTHLGRQEKDKIEVLMVLATFIVTITYAAGLNPPGGFWTSSTTTTRLQVQQQHLAGDPIMQDRDLQRYRAFFVCNTTAFIASLLIILLLLDKKLSRTIKRRLTAIYLFIAMAVLGLMGAYAAGSCRKVDNTVKVLSLAAAVPACVCLQLALAYAIRWKLIIFFENGIKDMREALSRWFNSLSHAGSNAVTDPDLANTRYFVMVLASLAVSITYQAGLDPPGGLWEDSRDGHKVGHPVLRTTHPARYKVFFYSNSAAFVTSLVVVMMVQSRFLLKRRTLLAAMVLDLIGLVIAYAAGSTRDACTSIYVFAISGLVLSYAVIHISLGGEGENVAPPAAAGNVTLVPAVDVDNVAAPTTPDAAAVAAPTTSTDAPAVAATPTTLDAAAVAAAAPTTSTTPDAPAVAATPTTPDAAVVVAAAPTTSTTPDAPAIAATPTTPDTAAAAPTTSTTPDAPAVAATPTTPTLDPPNTTLDPPPPPVAAPSAPTSQQGGGRSKDQLESKRQVLLIIAILVAALTYQAGLTPPGGFWPADDDQLGHRAGYPVLLDNYPRRYKAFFYCNTVSFMASVALILLLVNRKLYRPGIRCYALHVCMVVGMFALMGAYASGSTRHLKTSVYVLTLVAAVSVSILLQVVIFWYIRKRKRSQGTTSRDDSKTGRQRVRGSVCEKNEVLEYLMLLGVLIASVTYQTGLKPPGGIWQEDNVVGGRYYSAGNPILHDISKRRYNVFFYSNSASFMASIIVVVMLLPSTLGDVVFTEIKWPLWPVHTAVLMDMIGLLVANAAGSTRKWESSRNVIFLILPVLAYIVLYAGAAVFYIRRKHKAQRHVGIV